MSRKRKIAAAADEAGPVATPVSGYPPFDRWAVSAPVCPVIDFEIVGVSLDECIEYFRYIVLLVGCEGSPHVVSKAWDLICSTLASLTKGGLIGTGNPNDVRLSTSPCETAGLSSQSFVKSCIVTCVSLAVDVVADFECEYVVSGVAWGHLLYSEVTAQAPASDTRHLIDAKTYAMTDENAEYLMRMKLLVAQSIDWNLHSASSVDCLMKLVQDAHSVGPVSGLACCESMGDLDYGRFFNKQTALVHVLSLVLRPSGFSPFGIAVTAFVCGWIAYSQLPNQSAKEIASSDDIGEILATSAKSIRMNGVCSCLSRACKPDHLSHAAKLITNRHFYLLAIELSRSWLECAVPSKAGVLMHEIEESYEEYFDKTESELNDSGL